MDVSIDWYAGTFPGAACADVQGLLSRFVDSWTVGAGNYGYTVGLRGRGVTIYSGGQASMGVMAQVSGSGCNWLCTADGWPGWFVFVEDMRQLGVVENRTDVAFDDRSGCVQLCEIRSAVRTGQYSSVWRSYQEIASGSRDGSTGESVYLGSAQSELRLVVYDKRLERASAGEVVEGPWVRWELRYRQHKSGAFWDWMLERRNLVSAVELLSGCVRFVVGSDDVHPERLPTAAWWQGLIDCASRERVPLRSQGIDLHREVGEFAHQHGRTLAMLVDACAAAGVEPRLVEEIVRRGRRKYNRRSLVHLSQLIQSVTERSVCEFDSSSLKGDVE